MSGVDPLLAWRAEFPILEQSVYLVNHSLGAMPRAVYGELRDFADAWAERGVRAWGEGWWDLPLTVGNMLAGLMNAPAGSVAMMQNVTVAMEAVVAGYEWRGSRNGIVTTDVDFPSVLYLLEGWTRHGARVVRVPSADGLDLDVERVIAAIDESTRLVVLSHVLFRSARLIDPTPVVRRAREVGAHVVLDTYQSLGAVPVDATALDVDYIVGGSVKWLCGGPGAGYLYVKPSRLAERTTAFAGWQAHEDPFAFDPGPLRPRADTGRFLNGTPHVPCLYAARAGYAIIAAVGVAAIRARSIALTGRLIERADEYGFTVVAPRDPAGRGGSVILNVPEAEAVARTLIDREFIVDYRPGAGIRIGPHFYNTEDEVDSIAREIRNILAAGAHREYIGAGRTGH